MSDSTKESTPRTVQFPQERAYVLMRELGAGACGKTVLLYDEVIDEKFVCKKYSPYDEAVRKELFDGFLREIKLLHRLQHENIVRVFNYHVYLSQCTGFILMEYVEGSDIASYVQENPAHINQLFSQAVSGFQYMEAMGVLHRDIRPMNLLVTADGVLKIIDLGFGKRIVESADFDKSVSLNWWCEKPNEFESKRYDFTTEVYFVGKLFEKLIQEHSVEDFQHKEVLRRMCTRDPADRIGSFKEVAKEIRTERFAETQFTEQQKLVYREFAEMLARTISRIEATANYHTDIDRMKRQLSNAYRTFMLDEVVPDAASVTRCFVDGVYYYKKSGMSVETVKNFLDLLMSCRAEQSRIIIANLQTKLDAVKRYDAKADVSFDDDDIPF